MVDASGTPVPGEGATIVDNDPPNAQWHTVQTDLLELAAHELAAGFDPRPTLLAWDGDRPLAVVGLRPFQPGEILGALIELLALLLPLGADRLAFVATARVWSSDDPIPPVCDEGDLRQRAVVLATADAHGHRCALDVSLHPFTAGDDGIAWGPPVQPEEPDEGPVAAALSILLDQRGELAAVGDDRDVTAQLGRVLLLGHEVVLADHCADRLTAATTP